MAEEQLQGMQGMQGMANAQHAQHAQHAQQSFADAVAKAQQALSDLYEVREQIVQTENRLAYLQTRAALLLAEHRHFAKELETHL